MTWVHRNILAHVKKDYPELDINNSELEKLLKIIENSPAENSIYKIVTDKKGKIEYDMYSFKVAIKDDILQSQRYDAAIIKYYKVKSPYNLLNFRMEKEFKNILEEIKKNLGIENIINFNEKLKNCRYNLLLQKAEIILGGKGGYLIIPNNISPQNNNFSANKQALLIAKTYHKIKAGFDAKIAEAKNKIEGIRSSETLKIKEQLK